MNRMAFLMLVLLFAAQANGQQFEEKMLDAAEFDGPEVDVGADFAIQYQGLKHTADSALIPLGKNVNLPTANLNISADLSPGIRVNLITYLSSRHHPEAWVKGGYLLIDQLPFTNSSFLNRLMNVLTLKMGVMELNFGDAHFRRSDNGRVTANPFVGNYIMNAFTTAPAFEAMVRKNDMIFMGGITSGSLRPDLASFSGNTYSSYNLGDELGFYTKLGFDRQFTEDFRLRGTVSGYYCGNHHFGSLYNGDRTGSRYYLVMKLKTGNAEDVDISSGHTSGRWGPGFTDKNSAMMLNVFTKFHGLEFFGTYEKTTGTGAFSGAEFDFNQFALEALYRFGKDGQFYGGGRFNAVSNDRDQDISRLQVEAGWSLTENIMLKAEYVKQDYNNFTGYGQNAGFNGLMVEAAVSF